MCLLHTHASSLLQCIYESTLRKGTEYSKLTLPSVCFHLTTDTSLRLQATYLHPHLLEPASLRAIVRPSLLLCPLLP